MRIEGNKLEFFEKLMSDAKTHPEYERQMELNKKNIEQYNGSKKIDPVDDSAELPEDATVIRNITRELIESQKDMRIPAPKVTPRISLQHTERNAKAAEHLLNMLRDKLPFERMNNTDEFYAPTLGATFYLVEFDNSVRTHFTVGEGKVSIIDPSDIIPQPGIYDVNEMEYIVCGPQTLKVKWFNSSFATGDGWTTFASKRALIIEFDLYFANLMKDLTFETVFLPGAKLDENQKNYRALCGTGFIGVPIDALDTDCSALILEAFNRYSYANFRPVYFDSYLAYRISKDPRDHQVLQLILDNTVYDLGFNIDDNGATAGKASGMLRTVVYQNMSTNVASYIEQYEDTIRKEFEQTLSEIY